MRLHYSTRAFERENKTLLITGRRAAAGKLLGIVCWQVVRLCDWLCEQVVMFSIGCGDCGWFVWGGGRGSPPPLFEALIEHSTLSLAHCLSSTHYGWLCASLFAVRPSACVYFGLVFEWGSGKIMTIFSAFVLPSVYVNSSEWLVNCQQYVIYFPQFAYFISVILYGHWQYGSLCVCTSALVLSASAFSVYSLCLFLGRLIVPFQTIRCLLECSSSSVWEWEWAGCSYLKMQKCLCDVPVYSMLHQRDRELHYHHYWHH